MKTVFYACLLCGILVFSGCGSGYNPPVLLPSTFSFKIAGTKAMLCDKVANALSNAGYELQVDDRDGGQFRTAPRRMNVQPSECDCGSYYKKPYVKDPLTKIDVSIIVDVQEAQIRVSTQFKAVHYTKSNRPERELECISSGEIERSVAELVAGQGLR